MQFPKNTPQETKDKIFEQLKYGLITRHKSFNGKQEIGEKTWLLNEQSTGIRKLVGLLPLIISTLMQGHILFIDELNTSSLSMVVYFLTE